MRLCKQHYFFLVVELLHEKNLGLVISCQHSNFWGWNVKEEKSSVYGYPKHKSNPRNHMTAMRNIAAAVNPTDCISKPIQKYELIYILSKRKKNLKCWKIHVTWTTKVQNFQDLESFHWNRTLNFCLTQMSVSIHSP